MPRSFQLGYYLIAFIDVLGQRECLRQLRALPHSEQERCETNEILRHTAGFVLMLREYFEECFSRCAQPGSGVATLPRDQQQLAERLNQIRLDVRGISDSIIISVSLASDDEQCTPMNGIEATFGALCATFARSLSCGHLIRGGVDVGLGLRISPDEVYGPALERAYFLEAECAKYPRIVIGQELCDHLAEVEAQTGATPCAWCAKQSAVRCRTFLAADTDGQKMLDWLGLGARRLIEPMMDGVVVRAYAFVTEQERYYLSLGNAKLSERYARLRAYMAGRMAVDYKDKGRTTESST